MRIRTNTLIRLFGVMSRGELGGMDIVMPAPATIEEARNALARIDQLLALKATYEERLAKEGSSVRLQQIVSSQLSTPLTTVPALLPGDSALRFQLHSRTIKKLIALGILQESDRDTKPKAYISGEFSQQHMLSRILSGDHVIASIRRASITGSRINLRLVAPVSDKTQFQHLLMSSSSRGIRSFRRSNNSS